MFDSPVGVGLLVVIVLLLFVGPKQLPKLSRALGQSAKELKTGFAHGDDEDETGESADADSKKTTV